MSDTETDIQTPPRWGPTYTLQKYAEVLEIDPFVIEWLTNDCTAPYAPCTIYSTSHQVESRRGTRRIVHSST